MNANGAPKGGVPKMNVNILGEKKDEVLGSNYWAPLLTLSMDDSEQVNNVVDATITVSKEVALEVGVVKGATHKKTLPVLTRKTRKTILAKHALNDLAWVAFID